MLREIFEMLLQRRKVFLLPLMIFIIVIGLLLVLAQSSVIAPFIYTLF